ncbi:DNA-binding protein [Siphonobacter sp. BAB-5405]|uniref:PPC domain-containing DNA-binding protein n=1 Tax=Siphonobacter sp. BAB-5405 TaxID=1864825 RepID=UPI000C807E84|nr:PPC domain-containing DNA-binding protein [Siphonobacter sp. BAB-5405]PMD94563.1 DNA-binding protein [Siphonobacter sp. BAB-5405]
MKNLNYCITLLTVSMLALGTSTAQQKKSDSMKRYTKVPAGYLMVLRQDDDVLKQLEAFAEQEKIPSASFTGMGFVNVTFGFFNFETKEYDPQEFKGVELASMTGTIAWQKGKVSLHTHGVVTDKTFAAYGGHILAASVGTGSVEILITVHDKKLERVMEQPLGANVLHLEP